MIVYLCGGINGLSDGEAKDWRIWASCFFASDDCASRSLITTLDPMRRDYRGKEDESVEEIFRGDLADIIASDALLVNASRPSWGTGQEMVYARMMNKPVISIVPSGPISPWLRKHSTKIVSSLAEGCAEIVRLA